MARSILFIMWKFPRVSETFLLAQMQTAINAGFDVDVLLKDELSGDDSYPKRIKNIHPAINVFGSNIRMPSTRSGRLIGASIIFLKNLQFFSNFLLLIKELGGSSLIHFFYYDFFRKFRKYDIIHIQYGTNAKPLDLLKKYALINNKLVVSFHGHDAFFPINNRINDRDYYKDLFKYGDLFIANTPYLMRQLVNIGCPVDKIKTIPVGVNTCVFKPENKRDSNTTLKFITVGRLDKVKGHIYSIELVRRLKIKGYKISLTIIGDGPLQDKLQNILDQYNLKSEIVFMGKLAHPKIKQLLNAHDIYLSTSMPVKSGRRETQGLANLEAQACGLPIIAFDSGGVKYTLKDQQTGFLIPEGEMDQLLKKTELLIKDSNLRLKMGKAAVQFTKKNFGQSNIDRIWKDVYEGLTRE